VPKTKDLSGKSLKITSKVGFQTMSAYINFDYTSAEKLFQIVGAFEIVRKKTALLY